MQVYQNATPAYTPFHSQRPRPAVMIPSGKPLFQVFNQARTLPNHTVNPLSQSVPTDRTEPAPRSGLFSKIGKAIKYGVLGLLGYAGLKFLNNRFHVVEDFSFGKFLKYAGIGLGAFHGSKLALNKLNVFA